ncbi:hypothetical protein [Haloechinothrix salitolerans]|uniref:Uncharacterized protein n=1 Tax=Haloechinothrix salitolerans TaxID=926830 RepID=A0ABW2BWF1_9PSEU
MHLGIVASFNSGTGVGEIVYRGGSRVQFRFSDGRSIVYGTDLAIPTFSNQQAQPMGHSLKIPRVGDPVVFAKGQGEEAPTWGYARHVVDAVERRFGTEFK